MHTKGFTLLELILIIAIIGILAAVVIGPLASFRQRQVLQNTTNGIVALLNDARTKTLAALNDTSYGVHFEEDRAILFTGTTYSDSVPTQDIYTFDPSVEVVWDFVGSDATIVFERLTGGAMTHGTLTISISSGESRTITITSLGSIAKE